MGNLVWHEYSRLLSITATVYTVWAGFWGLFYRKFFWDFVGGTLRDPGGLQPSPNAAVFITLIVKSPIVQIFTVLMGVSILALECPLPHIQDTRIHRSIALRIIMLLFQASLAILVYQGTNGALWSLIAAGGYVRSLILGEKMVEAKENRGTGGRA